jgi:flagellar protein FliS
MVMNAYRAYTNVNAATASPQRIMMMLFESALANIRTARAAFERRDYTTGINAGEKAANIVMGLRSTLKAEVAPELCDQLDAVYSFVVGRLILACGKTSAQPAAEAERVFLPIVEAFGAAVAQGSGVQPLPQPLAAGANP